MKAKKKPSLTILILLALALGVLAGILLQGHVTFAETYIQPFGTIFLNLIKMIVVPVVLFSIIQGVVSLQDIKKVGSIGGKTICFYLLTTAFAVTFGLLFANVLHVGGGYKMDAASLTAYEATTEAPSMMDTLVNIFPANAVEPLVSATMLQVIVIALLFGFGIILAGEKGKPAADVVESFSEVSIKIMGMIINLSPIGVFALITPVIAANGPSVLIPLLRLIAIAYLTSIVHMVVVYSTAVKGFSGISPIEFFKKQSPAMLFSFSSASSVGTLPFNFETTKSMGVKKEISSFVLPLGATINMDGTAIYQGVSAIFIAQIFGMHLSIGQQLTIILTTTLASIGTAGVPGAGVVMLAMVLQSVGLPLEGIGLIAGVDRILDMARTVVNTTGDAACSVCVDAMEKRKEARKKAAAN